jgi:alpha-1,3/alpha-1,6-mannosyltransferase
MSGDQNLRIAFVHPDLGIGGAEQLVVNYALALQKKGHYVKIYTPFHDPNHCFKETKDGTIDVEVRGGIFPQTIFKKFWTLCAIIRMILCSLYVCLYGGKFDLIIVDQVSVCVPIIRLFNRKVIFYCHYPDKLLCVDRSSFAKKFYRFFLDFFEEITTGCANLILVNSLYTKEVFALNFKLLNKLGVSPKVLYPAIDLAKFDKVEPATEFMSKVNQPYFFSLNRYERKKNVALAIEAYAELKKQDPSTKYKLVIAGGYDPRIPENVEHLEELKQVVKKNNLVEGKDVQFYCSVSDAERGNLLRSSFCVLYTPENEHFGIVPTEAMYSKKPVIACNSGGPKESVLDGKTGYLLAQDAKLWGAKMLYLTQNENKAKELGEAGKKNVEDRFGMTSFANQTHEYALTVSSKKKVKTA